MFGNRRPEYEEEVPVYPSEGYGPAGEGVYGEDRRGGPYERQEYVPGEGRREQLYEQRERRDEEYGQPGGYGGGGGGEYGREPGSYGGGYGVPPPRGGEYADQGGSDLGMGARDSGISDGRGYEAAGYGARPGGGTYGGGQDDAEIQRLEQEVTKEKRREREAEAAAVAGVGFGLYEHHEKKEGEEQTGYGGEKKHHGFFGL